MASTTRKQIDYRKLFQWTAMTTVLAVLSGCFEIKQGIVIDDDQMAVYELEFGMASSLATMVSSEDGKQTTDLCNNGEVVDTDLPDGLTAETSSRFEADFLWCRYTISGHISRFAELRSRMEQKSSKANLVEIARLDDNRFQITSTFDFSDADSADDPEDGTFAAAAQGMLSAAFAGRAIRWSITAPEIESSNGQISEDRKRVNWEIPLSVALAESGVYTFQAVVVYYKPWYQGVLDTIGGWL